jgi:hypothetical protein
MIKHAWTVVCSKTIIDSDSNNISLDVTEQIKIQVSSITENQTIVIPGFTLIIASLWYQDNPSKPEKGISRIKYLDPSGSELGIFNIDLNLEKQRRLRTRVNFSSIPIKVAGWHFFVVEQKKANKWIEVARIPYEITIDQKK